MSKSRSEMVGNAAYIESAPIEHVTATSNDPWGPTGTDMSEIARLTFNEYRLHVRSHVRY